ncbi:hypothetical protein SSP531S_07700 [Streptomyces spongiicola]|uniref:Uncharacterized protein n=1 Tax=Streptomyces spongiicola TaxID=1690221 RepID=A0A2S1YZQ9_9ACTN|nr:hypothetical protein DDQ41_09800 [Streptomyces spongiicola]GBP99375.1 hypothetical protein SSP531S_07700 [Streptomyces spongiicola]
MTGGHPEGFPAHRGARSAVEHPGWLGGEHPGRPAAEHSGRTREDRDRAREREPAPDLVGAIIRAAPRAAALCTPPEPPRRSAP